MLSYRDPLQDIVLDEMKLKGAVNPFLYKVRGVAHIINLFFAKIRQVRKYFLTAQQFDKETVESHFAYLRNEKSTTEEILQDLQVYIRDICNDQLPWVKSLIDESMQRATAAISAFTDNEIELINKVSELKVDNLEHDLQLRNSTNSIASTVVNSLNNSVDNSPSFVARNSLTISGTFFLPGNHKTDRAVKESSCCCIIV